MTAARPNILFIMPDQLRADFLGCYGADFARTPAIDALVEQGTRYERCLSPNPICVPARASLLTGTTSLQNGVLDNGGWLPQDRAASGLRTWPSLLSRQGYHTYGVGKMHFSPWDAMEGFDTRVIAEDKRLLSIPDDYAAYLEAKGLRKLHGREMAGYRENAGACVSPVPAEQQVDAWCADRAIELLEAHTAEQPFAMMVGFPSPHCPYDPPSDVAALFSPEDMPPAISATVQSERLRPWLIQNMQNEWADIDYSEFDAQQIAKVRAHYSALIHLVDKAVGRIMACLEQQGLLDNTVVVFSSDHGDFVGDYGLVCKNFFMDASIRVPMIVRHPDGAAGVRSDTVCLSDVFPTFLAIAGVDSPPSTVFRSLLEPAPQHPRLVTGATHRGFMIECGRYKLARYVEGFATLHDRVADPEEQCDLYQNAEHESVRLHLDAALTQWQISEMLKGHRGKKQ